MKLILEDDLIKKALEAFETKEYQVASKLFQEVFIRSKKSIDCFNAVVCLIYLKKFDDAEEKFINVVKAWNDEVDNRTAPPDTDQINLASLTYNFMRYLIQFKEYNRAWKYFLDMLGVYKHLKITDSTFLYLRGIPFFIDFITAMDLLFAELTIYQKNKKLYMI
ncbi:MAG TPA: hypothetical protein PKC21_02085 [Oligoflexia bacterium]|nr:hypothetical protein [Oligoflexia bacterium]